MIKEITRLETCSLLGIIKMRFHITKFIPHIILGVWHVSCFSPSYPPTWNRNLKCVLPIRIGVENGPNRLYCVRAPFWTHYFACASLNLSHLFGFGLPISNGRSKMVWIVCALYFHVLQALFLFAHPSIRYVGGWGHDSPLPVTNWGSKMAWIVCYISAVPNPSHSKFYCRNELHELCFKCKIRIYRCSQASRDKIERFY